MLTLRITRDGIDRWYNYSLSPSPYSGLRKLRVSPTLLAIALELLVPKHRTVRHSPLVGPNFFVLFFHISYFFIFLDKQVSWLFLCWNMILLGSFYDTMTNTLCNRQHEIVFLDTNNNFKHFIFISLYACHAIL